MTTRELADLIFTPFQEDVYESVEPPWVEPVPGGLLTSRFQARRIGDVLEVTDSKTGRRFVVAVVELFPVEEPS